jgi:ATP-binding cassette subfamily C protein CydC
MAPVNKESRQLVLSVGFGLLEASSSALLLAISVWFICACAVAGQPAAAPGFNYLVPATLIRLLAITRIMSGYLEKYVGHRLLLNRLAGLRSRLLASVLSANEGPEHARAAAALQQSSEDWAALPTSAFTPQLSSVVLMLGLLLFAAVLLPSAALPLLGLIAVLAIFWVYFVRILDKRLAEREVAQAKLDRSLEGWLMTSDLWSLRPDWQNADAINTTAGEFSYSRHRLEDLAAKGEAVLLILGLFAAAMLFAYLADALATPVAAVPILLVASMRDWLRPGLQGTLKSRAAALGAESLQRDYLPEGLTATGQDYSAPEGQPAPANGVNVLKLEGFAWQREGRAGPSLSVDFVGPGLHLIVGPSGLGKSSLLYALCGELEHRGHLLLDGVEITCDNASSNPPSFYLAEQFGRILSDTLGHNLRLGAPDASDAELLAALDWAALDVEHNALQLRQWLGEQGRPLSGGERKRLALARARLSDAPIWLLDEPFEGLDAETARTIADRLNTEATRRLLIVVAHQYPENLRPQQTVDYGSPVLQID